MNHEEMSLYRTQRPRYVLYSTDGLGRDTYISFNNGGFWKDNVAKVSTTTVYDHQNHAAYHSIGKRAAPFRYYSDGSGRDSYVLDHDGGLKRDYQPLSRFHLKDFLRTPEECIFNFKSNPMKEGVSAKTLYVSKKEYYQNKCLKKLENDLIRRLYHSEKHKFIPEKKEW
jgi:hypothetical protein